MQPLGFTTTRKTTHTLKLLRLQSNAITTIYDRGCSKALIGRVPSTKIFGFFHLFQKNDEKLDRFDLLLFTDIRGILKKIGSFVT